MKLDFASLAHPLRSLRLNPFVNRKGRKVRKEKTSHLSPYKVYSAECTFMFSALNYAKYVF